MVAAIPRAAAKRVGIREFKAQLSRVVQQASQGEHFDVTDHGKVVAELGPVRAAASPNPAADVRERIVAAGGTAASRPFDLQPPPRTPDWQPIDALALLDDLRGER